MFKIGQTVIANTSVFSYEKYPPVWLATKGQELIIVEDKFPFYEVQYPSNKEIQFKVKFTDITAKEI